MNDEVLKSDRTWMKALIALICYVLSTEYTCSVTISCMPSSFRAEYKTGTALVMHWVQSVIQYARAG